MSNKEKNTNSFQLPKQLQTKFDEFSTKKHLTQTDKQRRLKVVEECLNEAIKFLVKNKTYPSRNLVRNMLGKGFVTYIEGLGIKYSEYLGTHFSKDIQHLFEKGHIPKMGNSSITNDTLGAKKRSDVNKTFFNSEVEKTFFVSAVVPGFSIDNLFLKSIENFCKIRNATLVLLPMKGLGREAVWFKDDWEKIQNYLYTTYQFNSSLKAFDILLNANQINPLTGLDRFGQKDFSLIVASPKQQMKSVAVSVSKPPHILLTTGTICKNEDYTNNRIGMLALQDHILGGLIVEVRGKSFHVRQVQASSDGSFVDIGTEYSSNKTKKVIPKLYLGDSHAGWQDEKALESTFEQIEHHGCKEIFIGDLFDGTSISHHHIKNIKAQLDRPHSLNTLEKELNTVASYLKRFKDRFPDLKINIIRSNHDEHLDKYLNDGRYVDDRWNHRLALDLAIDLLEGRNPIECWVVKNYPELKGNITWLKRTDSYKVKHIELAAHGDKGSNGSFGTALNLENSYGACVVGHQHTPQILRGVYVVGTLTKLQLPYTEGSPSSWLHANCSIYESGQRQMLIIINGDWKI